MGPSEQPSFFDDDPPGNSLDDEFVHFGTSSFSSKDWVGPFYPRGLRPASFLKFYATQFATVEIDATYYHIPSASTVDSWAAKTPRSFTIAAKFPRSIVHGGNNADPNPATVLTPDATYADRDEFLQVMSRLGDRLGPLLLQFPWFAEGGFAKTEAFLERLDRFLEDLPKPFQYAVEVRNPEWLGKPFARICHKHKVAPVLVDRVRMPLGDEVFEQLQATKAPFAYIRLLGNRAQIERVTTTWDREVMDWQGNMLRWAQLLRQMAQRRVPTYVFANNHYAGHGPTTIRRLAKMYHEAQRTDPTAGASDAGTVDDTPPNRRPS